MGTGKTGQAETGIDLSLATTDELWHELRSRYAAAMLVYRRPAKTDDQVGFLGARWGNAALTERIGLARFVTRHFEKELRAVVDEEERADDQPDDEDEGDDG